MKSSIAFSFVWLAGVAWAQRNDPPPYGQCNATDYYASLLASKPDNTTWTKDDLQTLVSDTHRRYLPNVAPARGDDDILTALADLYPGSLEETVYLTYRAMNFPAVPAGSSNSWRREDLWPIQRGVLRTSPALTDAHGKVPADSTVLFVKAALFFGECGTVEAQSKCQSPGTTESAADTASDGKIFTPPAESRGDIARAIFYTQLRYENSLGLSLTDCPPFGNNEFGYRSVLLQWHMDDPVSPEEMERNDRICSRWQGNRNPFVDYPNLVSKFYGEPDMVVPGTTTFSACTEPTNSPTATPNACSSLRAGDTPIYLINSDDPDQVVFYALESIGEDVEFLYVTDNAWTGAELLDTEGIMRFTVPEGGLELGQSFGFGPDSPFEENWESVGSGEFSLSTEGDQVFIYCLDADNVPNFLWGFSYNGPWKDAGLSDEEYGEDSSALPETLEFLGNTAIPHSDNCVFRNQVAGRKTRLQAEFMDPTLFQCNDDSRIEIDIGQDRSPPASARTALSMLMTGAMALASVIVVVML